MSLGLTENNHMLPTLASASKAIGLGIPYAWLLNAVAQAIDPNLPTVASVGMGAAGGMSVSVITYFIFKTRTEERLAQVKADAVRVELQHKERLDRLDTIAQRLDDKLDSKLENINNSLTRLVTESEFRARGLVKTREQDNS